MKYPVTAIRLRQALDNMNMTQQELADLSGIGKSSISHYINGANEPGNKSAYAMAKVLCVSPAWLMGLDVPMDNDILPGADYEKVSFDAKQFDKERIDDAMYLFEKYSAADPNVRAAVDLLLKSSQPGAEPPDSHSDTTP